MIKEITIYDNCPMYWGSKIRCKNFLDDLKEVMSNTSANYSVSSFVFWAIEKYELRKSPYFNNDACSLMLYCVYKYYKEFLKQYEKASEEKGSSSDDMNLLRSINRK